MKKIILLVLVIVSVNSFGQTLDTVYVRNLQLRAEEWYWLKGNWIPQDTIQKKAWKKIRTKLVSDNPPTNATLVTIDSIPGVVALMFYSMFINSSKGETGFMTNNISQNIKAYTPMLLFTNEKDAENQSRFQNARKNGRDDFDN
jgi:hypothetical protein